ncbi:MAG: OmpH family outer membrane protein [Acidobacteria bacterium]|nr:OmpH family outer membrane protein [Acidobacteriota bacterium]
MKVLKTTVTVAALTMVLASGPAFAQATPPVQNPPIQNPPAQNPPAQPPATQPPIGTQPPAKLVPPAQPPKPFPEGAKVGFIDLQTIASNSVEGKAATAKIQELNKKKTAELAEKNKQAQAIQTKLQQSGSVLSEQARGQAEKDLQKMQRDLTAMQEDAQQEIQEMTQQLQAEFQERLNPVIEQVATEKNLHVVFSVRDSGIVWAYSGVDISAEVIKRFDVAPKTAPKK